MTISTISTLPTAPARTDPPATFISRADAFLAALVTMSTQLNTSIGQMNTDIAGVNTDATTASNAATAAAAAQAAAEAASNATLWVSGTSYSAGDVVYSPINYLSYRANTATSGTTDPSLSGDWTGLNIAATAAVQTFLATPSSANLASAVSDETGSGALVFGTSPAITSPAITGTILEDVYALSGTTPAFDPDNGSVQTWTLSGNSTPTDSLSAGEAITLMIDDGTAYTITWPTMTWVNNAGAAPTLAATGYTVVALWKVSTTLYGALVGDGS